jgi:hypothetical protein
MMLVNDYGTLSLSEDGDKLPGWPVSLRGH